MVLVEADFLEIQQQCCGQGVDLLVGAVPVICRRRGMPIIRVM